MEKRKTRRLPFGGAKRMSETQPEIPMAGKRSYNQVKNWGEDDPLLQRAYRLGAPKKSKLAQIHSERDPEQAIRFTADDLRNTPYKNWTPSMMQDAQRYLNPQIVAAIIKEQQQKKR